MSVDSEIKKAFSLGPSDKDVILELTSLCTIYSLTPEKLKFKWEAFALTNNCTLKPTIPYITHLKKSMQRDFEQGLKSRRTVKGKIITKRATNNAMSLSDFHIPDDTAEDSVEDFMSKILNNNINATKVDRIVPMSPSAALSDTQLSETSSLFLTRSSSHIIENQYNSQLPSRGELMDEEGETEQRPITLTHLQKQVQPYRYMFEKIKDKADGLDERLDYIGSLIGNAYNIEEFGNPTKSNQETIYAYGRICSDSVTGEAKLNDKSIMLQTSKDLGMGRRVLLDLSRLEKYSLFPGEIVGVKGTNINGSKFNVSELLMPPMPEKLDLSTDSNHPENDGKPIEIVTARGPFTLDGDLSFLPLEELLKKCKETKPDIVLLMGPFLSSQHPKIQSGNIESLPEHIFMEQVGKRVEKLVNACANTQVLIMPHADDIIHRYPMFPQPALPETLRVKHDRIHYLSNPSNISINNHTLAIDNVDIIFRLAKEEISRNSIDRFHALSKHILQQHTYYPLFPYALGDNIDAANLLDIQLSNKPDLLIIPSQFKEFVKNVEDTVSINPGHLCKNQSGGTYANIILYPNTTEIRVDLIKL